jgi:hypothetical protein
LQPRSRRIRLRLVHGRIISPPAVRTRFRRACEPHAPAER